jgi:divalent metal cation (Fe/Co/Zn/Cd) transporter
MIDVTSSLRRAVVLEYVTIGASALEGGLALLSGVLAGSVTLVAFGADSVIEMLSALIVLGRLSAMVRSDDVDADKDHRSHRSIAALFFALALYVIIAATVALVSRDHPSENLLGLIVCLWSMLLMPTLAIAKRTVSVELTGSNFSHVARLMKADASETALCGLLSLSTLIGVILAKWVGWWWADPVASLVVVYFATREGREAWACLPD